MSRGARRRPGSRRSPGRLPARVTAPGPPRPVDYESLSRLAARLRAQEWEELVEGTPAAPVELDPAAQVVS
jgi:hypothetical protein